MSTLINIRRNGTQVIFEPASVTVSELVIWKNEDPQEPHQPSLITNQLGAAPSPNSSLTPLTNPGGTPPPSPPNLAFQISYTCLIPGHTETGTINVFNEFQAGVMVNGKFTAGAGALQAATKNQPIPSQVVAQGGMSKYTISGELFEITDANGNIIQSGSGPGPGLQLQGTTNNGGITVSGTPTVSGTYTFTFSATDGMGLNIQQNQYTMQVS